MDWTLKETTCSHCCEFTVCVNGEDKQFSCQPCLESRLAYLTAYRQTLSASSSRTARKMQTRQYRAYLNWLFRKDTKLQGNT